MPEEDLNNLEKKTKKEESKLEDMVGYFSGKGHPHPIYEALNGLRHEMLSIGFDEIQTDYFLPLKDIKQLTGDLYPAFMDSIYHLSWIGLDPVPPRKEVEMKLIDRFPDLDRAELWNILDDLR